MNFRRGQVAEEPEINLVPLIDVLLVILIFLMVTTSYAKFNELHIALPTAEADKLQTRINEINIAVAADGRYSIDRRILANRDASGLSERLLEEAAKRRDPVLVISADANTTHQSVVTVLEAARLAKLNKISFATQVDASKKP